MLFRSSDSDFFQLIADNVQIYNGITDTKITTEGYYDGTGKLVIDKKTGEPKGAPNPNWLLFEKCMRGDTSDNIFSAYPGVRKKGTKNKVGLLEAFDDRTKQGYNWNNLMLQRWVDHDGKEHTVLNDYERNRKLIDLSEQPKWVKTTMDETITEVVEKPKPKRKESKPKKIKKKKSSLFADNDKEKEKKEVNEKKKPLSVL